MKTIVFLFYGLMVHVNQPYSLDHTVVIPAAYQHLAKLRIPQNAVLNPLNEWISPFLDTGNHEYVIPLSNLKFRVEGTRGMSLDRRPTFHAATPRLRGFAPECELRKEVRERTITSKLISYVDLRGGRLTPDSYFSDSLEFEDGPMAGEYCVACKTRYEADLKNGHAKLIFTVGNATEVILIAGNSALEVSNLPPIGEGGEHWVHNYSICKYDYSGPVPKTKPGGCKNTPVCDPGAGPFFPDADCTNSSYP